MKEQERRGSGRIPFFKPILYIQTDSDQFIEATMLNHTPDGICFQSMIPISPGAGIYILNQDPFPGQIESRWADAVYARVMWCSRRNGSHCVGVRCIRSSISYDLDESGVLGSSVPLEASFQL